MSRDAVESEPVCQYVGGNPINYHDPAGLKPPPCTGDPTQICGTQPSGPITHEHPPQPPPPTPIAPWSPPQPPSTQGPTIGPPVQECQSADLFKAKGYAEGNAHSGSLLFGVLHISGAEVVYDFATMERAQFTFVDKPIELGVSGISTSFTEASYLEYDLILDGFHSMSSLEDDYKGDFFGFTGGVGFSPLISGFGVGFISAYSPQIQGTGEYKLITAGQSPIPIFSGSAANTFYTFKSETHRRYVSASGYVTEREVEQMKTDILSGVDSPWLTNLHIHSLPDTFIAANKNALARDKIRQLKVGKSEKQPV